MSYSGGWEQPIALRPSRRDHQQSPEHRVRQCRLPLGIWLKKSQGKLRLPVDSADRLAAESFESLPLMASHTQQISLLPWHHRDPFDRMLVAQAMAEKLILLTGDEGRAEYGPVVQLARRTFPAV